MVEEIEPGLEYTTPDNRGKCGFCGKEENGYAKRDSKGVWRASCWNCIRPKNPPKEMAPRKKVALPPDLEVDATSRGLPNIPEHIQPVKKTKRKK